MAGGAAVWCWYDVRAGCCCPLLYSYVGRGVVRSPTGAGIIGPARGGPVQRRRAAGAISYRRGLSGAICPAGRGAAVLSYIAMYGVAAGDLLPARHHRAATGKPPTENDPRKTGNKKRGRRGGGPCLPLFSRHTSGAVIRPGWAAGIHRGPFFPAWPSKCILAHFRPLERRRLLFFPRPLSAVSNLFVRILLNSDYSLFFSFHLWAFCSPLFVSESL